MIPLETSLACPCNHTVPFLNTSFSLHLFNIHLPLFFLLFIVVLVAATRLVLEDRNAKRRSPKVKIRLPYNTTYRVLSKHVRNIHVFRNTAKTRSYRNYAHFLFSAHFRRSYFLILKKVTEEPHRLSNHDLSLVLKTFHSFFEKTTEVPLFETRHRTSTIEDFPLYSSLCLTLVLLQTTTTRQVQDKVIFDA